MLKPLNRNVIKVQSRPVKVLQFGEGNFLRAFADWIIDILNEKTDFNGSVQIIQPLPTGLAELINSQDGLFHVLLHGIQHGNPVREARLITSVKGVINPYTAFDDFIATAAEPEIKFIISNTTEAGIMFSPADAEKEKIASTYPGKLTQWLYKRYKVFHGSSSKGLILLPCELIERNGEMLKNAIQEYIKLWNLPWEFAFWINSHCTFCNTLVDRIVPGFPRESVKELQSELGFEDNLLVKAEPFHLWVIEGPDWIKDVFPVRETELQIKFTNDLTPYRSRKVRILNGAHTSIVPVAYFKGLRTVQEVVEHPETAGILRKIIFDEIIPTLDLPTHELETFANDVLERFQNPYIRHELMSISLNSISKFKVRVLPSLLEYQRRMGKLPNELVNSLATLICFYRGEHNGEKINLSDSPEVITLFKNAWKSEFNGLAVHVLENKILWDQDLTEVPGLVEAVSEKLKNLLLRTAVL